jgi:hypothetical protein
MTDLITRAEAYDVNCSDAIAADIIRDLIAALQAAPTAEQLRGWAEVLWEKGGVNATAREMEAAADRMEGK